jgi:hypothetical protein
MLSGALLRLSGPTSSFRRVRRGPRGLMEVSGHPFSSMPSRLGHLDHELHASFEADARGPVRTARRGSTLGCPASCFR